MIKVELHTHTSDDPDDAIGYTALQLVDHAIARGYGALAITLHDRYFDDPGVVGYARDRGLTLIPSVERTIDGSHVLLVNFPAESARVADFDGLRALKARHPAGLVIAPHPWFPLGRSLGAVADRAACRPVGRRGDQRVLHPHPRFQSPCVEVGPGAPPPARRQLRRAPTRATGHDVLLGGRRRIGDRRQRLCRHPARTRPCRVATPVARHGGADRRACNPPAPDRTSPGVKECTRPLLGNGQVVGRASRASVRTCRVAARGS